MIKTQAAFTLVRFIQDYSIEKAPDIAMHFYYAGDVAELRDWLAESLVKRGIVELATKGGA